MCIAWVLSWHSCKLIKESVSDFSLSKCKGAGSWVLRVLQHRLLVEDAAACLLKSKQHHKDQRIRASLGDDNVLALFLYLLNESATLWRLCKCVTVIARCTSIFSSVYFTVCHINCWHATTHNISRNPWIIKSQLLLLPGAEGILSVPLFIQSLLNQHKL